MNELEFAKRLKDLRNKTGKTAKVLAIEAGISYNTYMRYEQGKFMPTIPAIIAIAKALQITTDELLGYSLDNDPLAQIIRELQDIGIIVEVKIDNFDDKIIAEISKVLDDPNHEPYGYETKQFAELAPIALQRAKDNTRSMMSKMFLSELDNTFMLKFIGLSPHDKLAPQKIAERFNNKIEKIVTKINNDIGILKLDKEKAPASEPTADKG